MWCKNVGRRFFRFVTIHTFDRETDGQIDIWLTDIRLHTFYQRSVQYQPCFASATTS